MQPLAKRSTLGCWISLVCVLVSVLSACGTPATTAPPHLRLATTTSTQDSGLLDELLPRFEKQYNVKIDVIAVGTGQALALGAKGDADVVLVHARTKEDQFVKDGDGINRRDVMYNDFVVVGPTDDPAGVRGAAAKDAFARIAQRSALFASRGDESGTYTKEQAIWQTTGVTPKDAPWYRSLGQGMGETLLFANEQHAYTITDRGTLLAMQSKLPGLAIMIGGASIKDNADKSLRNPYGVIPVNPVKHPGVNHDLAETFARWITSAPTQEVIGAFGASKYGQPLFYANAALAGQTP